jgi:hypothetical protein
MTGITIALSGSSEQSLHHLNLLPSAVTRPRWFYGAVVVHQAGKVTREVKAPAADIAIGGIADMLAAFSKRRDWPDSALMPKRAARSFAAPLPLAPLVAGASKFGARTLPGVQLR